MDIMWRYLVAFTIVSFCAGLTFPSRRSWILMIGLIVLGLLLFVTKN